MISSAKRMKLGAVFFRSRKGNEPVRDWLKGLSQDDKKRIGSDIQTVQFGWPLGMPLVGSLGKGLWEVRIKLMRGRIARVIFFMDYDSMVLANGFIKKTQKTPKSEIEITLVRKHEYESNN